MSNKRGPKPRKNLAPPVVHMPTSPVEGKTDLTPPSYFSPLAIQIWRRELDRNPGKITMSNASIFANLVGQQEIVEVCTEKLSTEGCTIMNDLGRPMEHPCIKMRERAARLVLASARQLGICLSDAAQAPERESQISDGFIMIAGERVAVPTGWPMDAAVIARRTKLNAKATGEALPPWVDRYYGSA
ncbi:MAG: hypothetical protein K2X93_16200 [Candidatus Obscuribacterales bacterium]|nr:hypothetical protein [Candidatus Obscuribacterales bacterium]